MEPDWRTAKKWSARERNRRTPRPISHPCHVICRGEMCWILHVYSTLYGVVYGVLTILYTECCIAKYRDTCYSAEHLLRVFLTPPAKVEPASPPPLDGGGSCGDLCPTLPGIRLVKGPIIITIIWGNSGLLQEIPAPVRSFTCYYSVYNKSIINNRTEYGVAVMSWQYINVVVVHAPYTTPYSVEITRHTPGKNTDSNMQPSTTPPWSNSNAWIMHLVLVMLSHPSSCPDLVGYEVRERGEERERERERETPPPPPQQLGN